MSGIVFLSFSVVFVVVEMKQHRNSGFILS